MGKPYVRVFLTGMMGAGKSSVGPRVAHELEWDFLDTDAMVEATARRSIRELFAEGEARFREREARAVAEACGANKAVIALGGGALESMAVRKQVLTCGLVVYLAATPAELMSRLNTANRPLLAGLARADLKSRLETLLAEREAHYRTAHVVIATDGLSLEDVTRKVMTELRNRGITA